MPRADCASSCTWHVEFVPRQNHQRMFLLARAFAADELETTKTGFEATKKELEELTADLEAL